MQFILIHEPLWLLLSPYSFLSGHFLCMHPLSFLFSYRRHPVHPLFLVIGPKVSYGCQLPSDHGRARRLLLSLVAVHLQVDDHLVCLAAPEASLFRRAASEHTSHLFFD